MTEPRDSAPRATMAVQVPAGPPPEGPDGNPLPMHPQVLEEVLRTLVKALRATAMYLPNNPIYQRAVDATRTAFAPVWESVGEVNLVVQELELVWEGQVVYKSTSKNDSISWLLFKGFWWRLGQKYVIRDFHPLVFFYGFGVLMTLAGLVLGAVEVVLRLAGNAITTPTIVLVAVLFIAGLQLTLFAMWFDMEANKDLR